MFKKGDRVKFLNDVGGGVVTRVENKTVYVENEDGFEVPSNVSQLLREDVKLANLTPFLQSESATAGLPNADSDKKIKLKTETESETVSETIDCIDLTDEPETPNVDTSVNILLAWIPQNQKNGKSDYDIYLVNDCAYHIMYVVAMVNEASYRGVQAGMLENETTIHLTQISRDKLKSVSSLHFDIIFFKKGNYLPHEPMHYKLKIDDFYITDPVNYVSNLHFDEKALIFNLSQEYMLAEIESVASELQKKFENQKKHVDEPLPVTPKKIPESDMEEVDLHIDQLVDNSKKLTPAEMLEIQMGHFNRALEGALEGAVKNRKKRIIFIHGVGNGRLRLEIQRALDKKIPKLRYQDASFKEYGYGATMVFV